MPCVGSTPVILTTPPSLVGSCRSTAINPPVAGSVCTLHSLEVSSADCARMLAASADELLVGLTPASSLGSPVTGSVVYTCAWPSGPTSVTWPALAAVADFGGAETPSTG